MTSPSSRPAKRTLVRWNDDLDKEVLLAVQYACAEAGIKIPWSRVAEVMGQEFSEGSVVQHLSKIRQKMVESGLHVPPPLRRGMVTKQPSKIYTTPSKKQRTGSGSTPMSQASTPTRVADSTTKSNSRRQIKPRPRDDDDDEEAPELYDSDAEFGSRRRKAKKTPKSSTSVIKPEPEEDKGDSGDTYSDNDDEEGPASRTRGTRLNYREIEAENSEEEKASNSGSDEIEKDTPPRHLKTEDTTSIFSTPSMRSNASTEDKSGSLKRVKASPTVQRKIVSFPSANIVNTNSLTTSIPNMNFTQGNMPNWDQPTFESSQQNRFWEHDMPQLTNQGYVAPMYTNPYALQAHPSQFNSNRHESLFNESEFQPQYRFRQPMQQSMAPRTNHASQTPRNMQNLHLTMPFDQPEMQHGNSTEDSHNSTFREAFDMGSLD